MLPARSAVEQRRLQIRAAHARRNRVDADPVLRPLAAQTFGQPRDAALADTIGRDFGKADERTEAGDVDEPAVLLFDHLAADHLAAAQRAGQGGVNDAE